MNIYIQHDGKFYRFTEMSWEGIKNYPDTPRLLDNIAEFEPTDNPQFAPGDRVWFEDIGEWTEVDQESCDCDGCGFDCAGYDICTRALCKGVIFRKLAETDEPEKSTEPITPPAPAAILDNERNRIAFDIFKILVGSVKPIGGEQSSKNYAEYSFSYADAFIARVKEEAGK